jgi:Amidase
MTATPHGALELVVNGVTAPWTHVMAATSPFNMTGLPALSVPYAFSSEQLPIGVQLVAKWLDEATILRLAQCWNAAAALATGAPSFKPHGFSRDQIAGEPDNGCFFPRTSHAGWVLNLRLARQRAMSPALVGAKKRSPLKGAPIIVRPEAWLPAIAGSSIGPNGSCRPPIRS